MNQLEFTFFDKRRLITQSDGNINEIPADIEEYFIGLPWQFAMEIISVYNPIEISMFEHCQRNQKYGSQSQFLMYHIEAEWWLVIWNNPNMYVRINHFNINQPTESSQWFPCYLSLDRIGNFLVNYMEYNTHSQQRISLLRTVIDLINEEYMDMLYIESMITPDDIGQRERTTRIICDSKMCTEITLRDDSYDWMMTDMSNTETDTILPIEL